MNELLNQAHASEQDQTVAKTYESRIPAEGRTLARFIGYIEMGARETTYQGQVNGSALKAKLAFELLGKNYVHTNEETNEKHGTLYYEDIFVKTGDKASFRKLLMKMRNGRENIKNMEQMLGETFIIKVVHNKSEDGKTYANIRGDGEWFVQPPIHEDPVSGEVTRLEAPQPTFPYRLLLWNNPSKLQWDSLFVDGTYTRKNKDGSETEVSKNWLQESIVNEALDFEGSALEALLVTDGLDLSAMRAEPAPEEAVASATEPAQAAKVADPAPSTAKTKEAPAEAKKQAPAASIDDALAELGLA